jgi:CRP/FNR family transcriptional regulator, cyclic AMP receptor protein
MGNQSADLLQRSSLTSDLTAEQFSELSLLTRIRELDNDEVLIEHGETDGTLYVIGDGVLAVERSAAGGEVVTLHLLKPGDLAGAMDFVDGTGHAATLRSVGRSVVVSLRREDLENVLTSNPSLVYAVMRGIVRSVHRILREMNLQYVELSNYVTKTHGRY